MELLYAGSVKNLYLAEGGEHLWFEYTDDYSVFDWGKMPDTIPGKGEVLARLGEWFFRALEDPEQWRAAGLAENPAIKPWLPIHHHFVERQGNRLKVVRVEVPKIRPGQVGGSAVYDYSYPSAARQLLPLEVIFRFGVPAGSSLLQRKDWYPFDIFEGAEFAEPLVEFSTKLESKDRMVSYQEAALILKGQLGLLEQIHGKTLAVAAFLKHAFAKRGLKLWDGKLEWAHVDGRVTLVDSIGPDELRVGEGELVFSKQFLRDFYLGSPWEAALSKAKKLAAERGSADWKTITEKELGARPGPLAAPYREAAQALYGDFFSILVEGKASSRFAESLQKL